MRLDVSLQQRLSQQLRLAPQIIQSIEILQLPAMDLKELIENELQENEILEVEEAPREALPAPVEAPPSVDEEGTDDEAERVFDRLEALVEADRRGARTPLARGRRGGDRPQVGGDAEHRRAAARASPTTCTSSSRSSTSPPDVRAAAEAIVYNLDEGGLLSLRRSRRSSRRWTSRSPLEEAEEALHGGPVARARGRRRARPRRVPAAPDRRTTSPTRSSSAASLRDHLDDLQAQQDPADREGARASPVERVYELQRGPPPPHAAARARVYSAAARAYIRPDVVVEWEGERVRASGSRTTTCRGSAISPRYRQLLQEAKRRPEAARVREAQGRRREVADRGDRAAREHARARREGDRAPPARLPRLRRQPPPPAEDAGGRRRARDPRLDGLARDQRQARADAPRASSRSSSSSRAAPRTTTAASSRASASRSGCGRSSRREDAAHPLSDDEVAERLSRSRAS